MTLLPRFLAKIKHKECKYTPLAENCWIWYGARDRSGYGRFNLDGINCTAHVVSYTDAYGPIPNGMQVDHICETPACVNPSHLQLLTLGNNVRRGRRKNKTTCKSGKHPWIPDNWYRQKNGYVTCRPCALERRTKN